MMRKNVEKTSYIKLYHNADPEIYDALKNTVSLTQTQKERAVNQPYKTNKRKLSDRSLQRQIEKRNQQKECKIEYLKSNDNSIYKL